MRFLPKDLDFFKIQTSFKLDLFLETIFQNIKGIANWAKKQTCYI
jgi:hypothetical protein